MERSRRVPQIVCLTLWFPEHNNVRYEQLLPRLEGSVQVYKLTLSRLRIVRAVQFRAWQRFKKSLIYPVIFRFLARKYAFLLALDTDQVAAWPRANSIIVDTDDPMFSPVEVKQLAGRQVQSIVVTTDQVRQAFQLAFGRVPTEQEAGIATGFVQEQGLFALCRSLFNSNEFVYVD